MTTPQKPEVDLMPPGVVNHELTKRMLALFNSNPQKQWRIKELYPALDCPDNDFEVRNTLVQLVVSHKIQRTRDYQFFAVPPKG